MSPLVCGCDSDYGDSDWYYSVAEQDGPLKASRARRCRSCQARIPVGAIVLAIYRWRYPCSDVEERILGEGAEIDLATWYLCEVCGELFSALSEVGFCISPDENMHELLEKYQHMRRDGASG